MPESQATWRFRSFYYNANQSPIQCTITVTTSLGRGGPFIGGILTPSAEAIGQATSKEVGET